MLRSPAAPSFSAVFDGRDQIISTCPAVRSLEQDLMRSRRAANQLDRCGGVIRYDLGRQQVVTVFSRSYFGWWNPVPATAATAKVTTKATATATATTTAKAAASVAAKVAAAKTAANNPAIQQIGKILAGFSC